MDDKRRTALERWITVLAVGLGIVLVLLVVMVLAQDDEGGGHKPPFQHGAGPTSGPQQVLAGSRWSGEGPA